MGKGGGVQRGVVAPVPTRSFFYLVKTKPPTRADFLSYFARGKVRPGSTPQQIEMTKGVSIWQTREQVRRLTGRMREHYDYIAELAIPEGVVVVRQGEAEGHHNVFASPDDLLGWVVDVEAV